MTEMQLEVVRVNSRWWKIRLAGTSGYNHSDSFFMSKREAERRARREEQAFRERYVADTAVKEGMFQDSE